MRENLVRTRWAKGEAAVSAWLHNPSSYSAELMANQPFDAVTVDLQHGMIDFQVMFGMFQAISSKPPAPFVRVPSHDPAMIMKVLDAGAYGVICPLVETAEECDRFVRACKYPPRGYRSNGSHRAVMYAGADYQQHADDAIVTLAMIESGRAIENLDAILSVEGLDGVFVGPTDLAFDLGAAPSLRVTDPRVAAAMATVAAKCTARGRRFGWVSADGVDACEAAKRGATFIVPGTETGMLADAAAHAIRAARGAA